MLLPSVALTIKQYCDTTYTYTYDTVGNILTANGHTYTYGNADWKDLLTAYDGETISYDASGNPTSYYNGARWTFTWNNGRSLTRAVSGSTSVDYTYDLTGLRNGKTVGDVAHKYFYAGSKLMRETYGSNTLDFFYDANGMPYALKYNGTVYYYVTNLQGDVIQIIDANGGTVASYEYDPYGKVISATGTLAEINPLRYRGYYFDTESGLYYLQSRYYDPETCRFLNHDDVFDTDAGFQGFNLFVYCGNNPVCRIDVSGTDSNKIDEDDITDEEFKTYGSGGSGGSLCGGIWTPLRESLRDAADGMQMASGTHQGYQVHHIASNKNKTYGPYFKEILDRYYATLDQPWNTVPLHNHRGRHTDAYHEFALDMLLVVDSIAQGDKGLFEEGFEIIKEFLRENEWLPYAHRK